MLIILTSLVTTDKIQNNVCSKLRLERMISTISWPPFMNTVYTAKFVLKTAYLLADLHYMAGEPVPDFLVLPSLAWQGSPLQTEVVLPLCCRTWATDFLQLHGPFEVASQSEVPWPFVTVHLQPQLWISDTFEAGPSQQLAYVQFEDDHLAQWQHHQPAAWEKPLGPHQHLVPWHNCPLQLLVHSCTQQRSATMKTPNVQKS